MTKSKAPRGAATQADLGAAIGVSRKTINRSVKRADWPVRRAAPWTAVQVEQVRRWWAELDGHEQTAGNGSLAALRDSPERLAKLRLMLTRREILELDRAIKAGEYVKLAEVEAGRVARIQAVKTMLLMQRQRVELRLRSVIKNEKTIGKIGAIIRDEARRILKTFAGQSEEAED